jgi:hypothetical protein
MPDFSAACKTLMTQKKKKRESRIKLESNRKFERNPAEQGFTLVLDSYHDRYGRPEPGNCYLEYHRQPEDKC